MTPPTDGFELDIAFACDALLDYEGSRWMQRMQWIRAVGHAQDWDSGSIPTDIQLIPKLVVFVYEVCPGRQYSEIIISPVR